MSGTDICHACIALRLATLRPCGDVATYATRSRTVIDRKPTEPLVCQKLAQCQASVERCNHSNGNDIRVI